MDAVLVIDKPEGLTSHDVVVGARRLLGERRIGHTGTLDPIATGVLPLACGRATRLVRFLSASDKQYNATIRFGFTTGTYDVSGDETSRSDTVPARDELIRALESVRGEHLQTPPPYSAKKIGGTRAYALARRDLPVALTPVPVTLSELRLVEYSAGCANVQLTCSSGFYVRAFAHGLGQLVGTGACLEKLRRTRSGAYTLDMAVTLERLQDDPDRARAEAIPLELLLPELPALHVNEEGQRRIAHGRDVEAGNLIDAREEGNDAWVRLVGLDGALLALGTPGATRGSLHPSVVLI